MKYGRAHSVFGDDVFYRVVLELRVVRSLLRKEKQKRKPAVGVSKPRSQHLRGCVADVAKAALRTWRKLRFAVFWVQGP